MDLAAVTSLAFVASITPGPNNLMLWASGLNHGVRRTLGHLAGVALGFALLLFLVSVGLGSIFERFAGLELGLRLVGGAYLLYLAYRIFTASSLAEVDGPAGPMTLVQAMLFQWVNPKAWVMTVTASSIGLPSDTPLVLAALALTGIFAVVNLPCISAWMLSGSYAARFFHEPSRLRAMNRVLGLMLAATVVLIVT